MIVLQFSTTRHIGSALIRWATWSWASHVDLVLPDGRLLGAIPGGVQIHYPNPAQTRVERFSIDADVGAVDSAMRSQLGKPYDYLIMLSWPIRYDWRDTSAWFCSDLVAWAFEQSGIQLLRFDKLNRIMPRDLLLSPLLTPTRPDAVSH